MLTCPELGGQMNVPQAILKGVMQPVFSYAQQFHGTSWISQLDSFKGATHLLVLQSRDPNSEPEKVQNSEIPASEQPPVDGLSRAVSLASTKMTREEKDTRGQRSLLFLFRVDLCLCVCS